MSTRDFKAQFEFGLENLGKIFSQIQKFSAKRN